EYLESWTASGGRAVTGVERSQPPLYYALASLPFRLTEGAPVGERLFTVRLLSVAAGVVTAGATWLSARWLWPRRPLLALLAAGVAVLAPGHLFLLASVNNDPLATALASVAGLAAVRLWLTPWPARWRTREQQGGTWDVGRGTSDFGLRARAGSAPPPAAPGGLTPAPTEGPR
ncbi:MAG TPA: hypothetical protein VH257_18185, partial [Chloroflexota bacterium]|nr:hypothetical protein [Chloroflexota bacterium]